VYSSCFEICPLFSTKQSSMIHTFAIEENRVYKLLAYAGKPSKSRSLEEEYI